MGRAAKKRHCGGRRVAVALGDGKDFENALCSQLSSITLPDVAPTLCSSLPETGCSVYVVGGRNPVQRNTAWDVINTGFELLSFTELSWLLGRERR